MSDRHGAESREEMEVMNGNSKPRFQLVHLVPSSVLPAATDDGSAELSSLPLQIRDIGSGNFGIARLMRDNKTDELVAVKFIERGEKVGSAFLPFLQRNLER